MPAKKTTKSKSQSSATRQRSKSAGRATPKSRSRTPSRSRSRSRVATVSKRSRTPASESKIRRRRSPSSSSSSSERSSRPSVSRGRVPSASGDKRTRASAIRETTPTRVSQRIIYKAENRQQPSLAARSLSPASRTSKSGPFAEFCHKVATVVEEKVFPPSVRALLGVVTFLPLFYWFNFLVITPPSPTYRFAGVLWPTDWHVYFDYRCHAFVLLYLLLHFLLARFIPFGNRLINNNTDLRRSGYKANGLFALVLFGTIFVVLQFEHLPQFSGMRPSTMVLKYWSSLLAATGNIATIAAALVLFASRRLPRSQCSAAGNTGNLLIDFWYGRPLRPRWFGLDWKMVFHRPAVVGLLLVEATCLCAQWERYGRVSPALALLTALHSIWLTDTVTFEYALATSFEIRHQGFGYLSLGGSLLFPFLYGLPAVYMLSKPDLGRLFTPVGAPIYSHWALNASSVVIFLLGYWIYRASNNQKNLFRNQPNHPSFTDISKISGPHTQRLLTGGWWGFSRHPNYLGDLMMAYAAALPSGFATPLTWIYPLFLTAFLLFRICETEQFCSEKYGISWTMYKNLVPYKLIPKIY